MGPGKFTAELVEIHRLVVMVNIGKAELASRNHGLDVVLVREEQAGAVHPGLVFGRQGQAVPGVLHQAAQHGVVKNDVGLQKQGILLQKVFPGKKQGINIVGLVIDGILHIFYGGGNIQGINMAYELLPLVANNQHNAGEPQLVQLSQGPVDEGGAAYLYHALCVVLGQLL